jgi:hypothetical protein
VIWVLPGDSQAEILAACEGLMGEWWEREAEHQLYRPVSSRVGIPVVAQGLVRADWNT